MAKKIKWENSKMDKKLDKAAAKKAKVSLKKWEGSAADEKKDSEYKSKFLAKQKKAGM